MFSSSVSRREERRAPHRAAYCHELVQLMTTAGLGHGRSSDRDAVLSGGESIRSIHARCSELESRHGHRGPRRRQPGVLASAHGVAREPVDGGEDQLGVTRPAESTSGIQCLLLLVSMTVWSRS